MGGGGGGGGGGRARRGRTGGGGEGGLGSGAGSRRRPIDTCQNLRFDTALMSPQPATANLTVGDVLGLRLGQQQNRPIVEAVDNAGALVGTITSAQITELIDCMQRGHSFVADVIRQVGGTCRVTVHHQ
jgi:hypothetical protein